MVDARLTQASGTAETNAACEMIGDLPATGRITVGADKAYDTAAFVARMRELGVTPHVAQNINAHRGSNIDARTTRHAGYRASQVVRKRIEEANGWIKCVAGMEQTRHRGLARVGPQSFPGLGRSAAPLSSGVFAVWVLILRMVAAHRARIAL